MKRFNELLHSNRENKFLPFTIALAFIILFEPFLDGIQTSFPIVNTLIMLSLVLGVYSIGYGRVMLSFVIVLVALTIVFSILKDVLQMRIFGLLQYGCNILFFGIADYRLIKFVAKSKNVTANIIYGAICGYLLMGFIGAMLFDVLTTIAPNSLDFPYTDQPGFHDFLYFSFVTLSTLGYGDVTPAAEVAQSLSILLSVTGQMYLTVLVAMLVGKYLNDQNSTK
ncbi:potassium channel family protein [Flammeovirgaceae bacterium SG7u.111]|nr:potassium channel family protein [Flammeovirgaceae bacterium SG7u.132]WPO36255.1 potassium channel family protein [Flammeovirgaceae bacterium SG7u.111]